MNYNRQSVHTSRRAKPPKENPMSYTNDEKCLWLNLERRSYLCGHYQHPFVYELPIMNLNQEKKRYKSKRTNEVEILMIPQPLDSDNTGLRIDVN